MSDFGAHSLHSVLTEELARPDLDNADIKYYQTADELLRQKRHAPAEKWKLNSAWYSAEPEQRRAIKLEIERLGGRIGHLHTLAKERVHEEGEALLREAGEGTERERKEDEYLQRMKASRERKPTTRTDDSPKLPSHQLSATSDQSLHPKDQALHLESNRVLSLSVLGLLWRWLP